MPALNQRGFGWKRGSRRWLYDALGLFHQYQVHRPSLAPKAFQHDRSHNHATKQTGKHGARNPPALFDEAGTGNVANVEL
jgi:hypothetical protein